MAKRRTYVQEIPFDVAEWGDRIVSMPSQYRSEAARRAFLKEPLSPEERKGMEEAQRLRAEMLAAE